MKMKTVADMNDKLCKSMKPQEQQKYVDEGIELAGKVKVSKQLKQLGKVSTTRESLSKP